jgi:amino acid transporter
MSVTPEVHDAPRAGHLNRTVGFYGLMFVSLGSIIGSGWLLGALNAAELAGPASILAWFLAALMLGLLALVYAELGATYPVAGAGGRFSYYSHGSVAGFNAGWAAWLQAVFIAPIEVLACIEYTNSVGWVEDHFNMIHADSGFLNVRGYVVAIALMLLFMTINLAGAEFLSESNTYVVLWKFAVPVLAILVVATLEFNGGNFTTGGGFMPHGMHGVFAALTGGVVFATQGFEQAVQFAGEARNPRRDLSRAILIAMLLGAVLYSALQIALIGAVNPGDVADNWDAPLGSISNVGAWYTLALAVGAGWLAKVILVDAVISPAGTGIVYLGTTARLSYALGEEREMPASLASTNAKGVPVVSILLATVIGMVAFGPFPSWNSLVNAVTGATAVMYGMAPIALGALRASDADRPRTYQVPMPGLVLPASFASANLILYFGGFDTMYKVIGALVLGLALFAIGSSQAHTGDLKMVKHALWIPVWLVGMLVISALGRYGDSQLNVLPAWIDLLAVVGFNYAVYFWAVRLALPHDDVQAQLARDAHQLAHI